MTIPVHLLIFFASIIHHKTCPVRPFRTIFVLFFLPPVTMHPIASILTHHYPSALIFEYFWKKPQNIMSGEISPAIVSQKYPAQPFFGSVCLVFVSPCAPTHPSTPIHTEFHLFAPIFTPKFNVYMYNLI